MHSRNVQRVRRLTRPNSTLAANQSTFTCMVASCQEASAHPLLHGSSAAGNADRSWAGHWRSVGARAGWAGLLLQQLLLLRHERLQLCIALLE